MASFFWTGGKNNIWDNSASWTPSGPPASGDDALLDNLVGSAITGNGSALDALFTGGGTWSYGSGTLSLGQGSRDHALAVVDGTLTINGGRVLADGTVDSGNAPVVVGGTVSGGGLTVVGNGTLAIGAAGTLSVIEANQTALYGVEIAPSRNGQATVSGVGALLDAGLNGISVGHGAGSNGTLTIGAGGKVLTGTTNDAQLAGLAVARQGTGSVNVQSGGSLAVNGNLYIGRAGVGTLTILNGGMVSQTDAASTVFVGVGGGASTVYYGGGGGGTIAAGATLVDAGSLVVGGSAVSGNLRIDGEVDVSKLVTIGNVATVAAGTTLVSTAGTTIATSGTVLTPGQTINDPSVAGEILIGQGLVIIEGNGVLNLLGTASGLAIGQASGTTKAASTAVVSVFGNGRINGGTNSITVGSIAPSGSTLALFGGEVDAAGVTINAGSDVHGYGTLQAAIVNHGTISTMFATGNSTLTIVGNVTGTGGQGVIAITSGETIDFQGSVDATQTLSMSAGAILRLAQSAGFLANVGTFGSTGTIVFDDAISGAFTDATDKQLKLTEAGGSTSIINFGSDASALTFVYGLACFASGTRIATARGDLAVEDVAVGDVCVTVSGGARPVVWVGSRTIDLARHHDPERVRPVRVAAGAFGRGLPARDLRLSPDHAVFVDGHLIPVRALVDGGAISADDAVTRVTYHHVELDTHDVILAEGLPAESFLDTGNKTQFAGSVMALRPDFTNRVWEAEGCAPLTLEGPVVEAARARLAVPLAA